MALPKLNQNLKYEMVIPSSDKVVTYRPYLVKEEKLLLSAFESQDQKQAMRAMVEGCDKRTDVDIDLSSLEVTKQEDVDNVVQITDDISIELRYPTYDGFVKNFREGVSEAEFGFMMIEDCMISIMTDDEHHLVSDVSKKELAEFIDSMTNIQFTKVGEFLKTVPVMKKDVEFTCECGFENKVTLEGLQDFF